MLSLTSALQFKEAAARDAETISDWLGIIEEINWNRVIGTFLNESMVGWQAWPAETIDPSYMVQGQPDPKTQQPYDPKTLKGSVRTLRRTR